MNAPPDHARHTSRVRCATRSRLDRSAPQNRSRFTAGRRLKRQPSRKGGTTHVSDVCQRDKQHTRTERATKLENSLAVADRAARREPLVAHVRRLGRGGRRDGNPDHAGGMVLLRPRYAFATNTITCPSRRDDCISSGGLNAAPAQSRRFSSLVRIVRAWRGESARCWAVGAAIPTRWAAPRSPRSKREGPGVVERARGRTVLAGDRACGGHTPR